MTAILQSAGSRVQGFLGPRHVCTVMGYSEYEPIARRYRVPIVITGFEPVDMLEGVLMTGVDEVHAVPVEHRTQGLLVAGDEPCPGGAILRERRPTPDLRACHHQPTPSVGRRGPGRRDLAAAVPRDVDVETKPSRFSHGSCSRDHVPGHPISSDGMVAPY